MHIQGSASNGEVEKYNQTHPTKPLSPSAHQWLSAVVGAIVNAATHQTIQTGAAEAIYGTKWNDQKEDDNWTNIEEALYDMNQATEDELMVTNQNLINVFAKIVLGVMPIKNIDDTVMNTSYLGAVILQGVSEQYSTASTLYQHAIDGKGAKRWFDKNSHVAKDIMSSENFRKRVKTIAGSYRVGESRIVSFSEEIKDGDGRKFAFGSVKFAAQITKNADGTISVKGQARDTYDFSFLQEKGMAQAINNIAYYLQYKRELTPYIWGAEIEITI